MELLNEHGEAPLPVLTGRGVWGKGLPVLMPEI